MNELPDPEAAQDVNLGEPAVPLPAATVILLRDSEDDGTLEVLLLKRTETAKFMPNVWVFPGGKLDLEDGEGNAGLETCARRELTEESGIELDLATPLIPLARWVTPEVVSRRFDTWFFLAPAPEGAKAIPDGSEMTDARWIRPSDALAEQEAGELQIVFPTIKQLEKLVPSATTAEAIASAEADPAASASILPKVVGDKDSYRIVLPHEDDYPTD